MRLRFALSSAFFLLALAPSAHALSPVCEQVKSLQPVSHTYVQKVLERADRGITYARSADRADDFSRYLPDWAKSVGSAWAGLMTSDLPLTLEQNELTRVTACLHLDVLLIECKMDEVRSNLREQISRGSILGIMRLEALLSFLNERVYHLRRGALDPLYGDPDWGKVYDFDPPAEQWCCPEGVPGNVCQHIDEGSCIAGGGISFTTLDACQAWGCTAPEEEEPSGVMCPFDANYAPAFQSGFGCDTETMQPRSVYPPMQAEMEALDIIKREVQMYQSGAVALLDAQRKLDELFGEETELPKGLKERKHLDAYGCGFNLGRCEDEDGGSCTTDADCGESITCVIPEKVCSKNRIKRCQYTSDCGDDGGECIENEEGLPAARELRGPFSLKKDQISILSEFLGVRAAQEISRTFKQDLKIPSEFTSNETEARDDRAFEQRNPLSRLTRSSNRLDLQLWSRIQAREEALIFPAAVDAQLEVANALTSLREAVSRLSRLASKKEGVRQFVGRLSYFIARTCTERPCTLILERVIRITTTDACFPYTDGAYLSDDADNPRWRKCLEAAGISE